MENTINLLPNNNFAAVYNICTKHLAILYGNKISEYLFTEEDTEWVVIHYNADPAHSNYLHVQYNYYEYLQLLFYPRLREPASALQMTTLYPAVKFHSGNMYNIPS